MYRKDEIRVVGQVLEGFWRKTNPLCERNLGSSDPLDRICGQLAEFVALLIADRGSQVLDFHQSLTHEDSP